MREYQTTSDDFKLFKQYALGWRDFLGLQGWALHFAHEEANERNGLNGNKAMVEMNRSGMVATIWLNKNWEGDEPTNEALCQCALHECLEILLRPLLVLAEARFNVDDADIEYEKHRIIRTLEYAFREKEVWDAAGTKGEVSSENDPKGKEGETCV